MDCQSGRWTKLYLNAKLSALTIGFEEVGDGRFNPARQCPDKFDVVSSKAYTVGGTFCGATIENSYSRMNQCIGGPYWHELSCVKII